jgi:hypothetical protein
MTVETSMRGRLVTPERLLEYLLAGRAVVTVRSRKTESRVTLKVGRKPEYVGQPLGKGALYFRALAAPDNERDFHYLGCLDFAGLYHASREAGQFPDHLQAARWLSAALVCSRLDLVLKHAEVWHEGRCGRCGRQLTVPESIETGFGPECAGKRQQARPRGTGGSHG